MLQRSPSHLFNLVSIRQTINLFVLDKWQPVIPTWTHKIRLWTAYAHLIFTRTRGILWLSWQHLFKFVAFPRWIYHQLRPYWRVGGPLATLLFGWFAYIWMQKHQKLTTFGTCAPLQVPMLPVLLHCLVALAPVAWNLRDLHQKGEMSCEIRVFWPDFAQDRGGYLMIFRFADWYIYIYIFIYTYIYI